jgi:hypothetical protein
MKKRRLSAVVSRKITLSEGDLSMARVRTRFPNVFVGHPFASRFPVKKFRKIFKELPFKVIYGNTDFQAEHLLDIMRGSILKADFSIFDLSNWNPNVALELGLAQGLKKKPGKAYYIILNTRRSENVPSDIQGIQRLEYTSYDYKAAAGLGDQLFNYVLSKQYWIKKIWAEIPESGKGQKKRLMAARILAHMRDYTKLTSDNLQTIARGTRLREVDRNEVVEVLRDLKLIRKIRNTDAYTAGRKLFS